MNVLIANQNEGIIRNLVPHKALNITPKTKNTSILNVHPKTFQVMQENARERGYNVFALFAW